MANVSSYVRCFVPSCGNTSVSPNKLFFSVPKGEKRRRWTEAVGMKKGLSLKTPCRCCEDHFEVKKDVKDWNFYCRSRNANKKTRLQLKPNVLPHIFLNLPKQIPNLEEVHEANPDKEEDDVDFEDLPQSVLVSDLIMEVSEEEKDKNPDNGEVVENLSQQLQVCPSLVKAPLNMKKRSRLQDSEDIWVYSQDSLPSAGDSQKSSSDQEYALKYYISQSEAVNKKLMKNFSRLYLGIPEEVKNIIPILEKHTKLSQKEIYLVLRKIRMNESLEKLSLDFGIDKTKISRSLHQATPILAAYLSEFIFWPERSVIQSNVPIAFRARFSKVESIIDCFEIEIQKPSNPLHQAQTWSHYKSANTVKYLISCTPGGHINFVSKGFAGRTSDAMIVQHSGFLSLLNPDTIVMADREFKHCERLLAEKGCHLIRPPSSKGDLAFSETEVREAKMIASLRIHVERVIRRIREFKFLQPHSCLNHELVSMVDSAVLIACGLCSFQSPLVA